MNSKKLFLHLFLCLIFSISTSFVSLAALKPGDLAIVGINGDLPTPKGFSIVALADIKAGEVIRITDRGWHDTNDVFTTFGVTTSEGTITWTPTGMIAAGTVMIPLHRMVHTNHKRVLQDA